jgi:hypothetical protein
VESEPGAVGVSAGGLIAALAVGEDVLAVNLATGGAVPVSCGCRVTSFDRLAGELVFHAVHAPTGARLIVSVSRGTGGALETQVAALPETGGSEIQ